MSSEMENNEKESFSNIAAVVIDYIVAVSFFFFPSSYALWLCIACVQLYRKILKKSKLI